MARAYELFGSKKRVNILKKVKVNGVWKFCPVVAEANGRLKDKVRINGSVEVHLEGVYYLEWRENGRRMREAVPDKNNVLRLAQVKALELDSPDGHTTQRGGAGNLVVMPQPALADKYISVPVEAPVGASESLFRALACYVRQVVREMTGSNHTLFTGAGPCEASGTPLALPAPANLDTQSTAASNVKSNPAPSLAADGRKRIDAAVDAYLKDIEPPQREPKTYNKYRATLNLFRDTCGKEFLEEINRDDCLAFIRHLYSIGNSARTAHNRVIIVLQLLKLHGIKGLLRKRDKPKYVETIREMYQVNELEALFKACDPEEQMRYSFFLLTGERDEEVQHTTWDDIDFQRKCVRVTEKRELGFKPKDKEEREIPVPVALLDALKEHKTRQTLSRIPNPSNLLFPTSQGRPDKKFENKLKKIAHRAGLNCGRCASRFNHRCADGPHCGKWFLHKFRHTYATSNLEGGVSIRTLQEWLGHSDLESTIAYLKYVRGKDVQRLVDNSELANLTASSAAKPSANSSEPTGRRKKAKDS